jgi:hypothetical protein
MDGSRWVTPGSIEQTKNRGLGRLFWPALLTTEVAEGTENGKNSHDGKRRKRAYPPSAENGGKGASMAAANGVGADRPSHIRPLHGAGNASASMTALAGASREPSG